MINHVYIFLDLMIKFNGKILTVEIVSMMALYP